jgi:DDE superfamily endonuclease
VRPGREHDTTRATAAAGPLETLATAHTQAIPTLTDLGYEGLSSAIRHPVKRPKGRDLTHEDQAYNALIRGVHALAERANSPLKTTFKALRRVSLDPNGIGAIVKAALVLLRLEYNRTI